jgi:hypothetical protein
MLGVSGRGRAGGLAGAALNAVGQFAQWAGPKVVFVAGLLTPGPEEIALYALGNGAKVGGRLVIGKLGDLEGLGLRPTLRDLGSPRANWRQNASLLRQAMRRGEPIMDASTDPTTGALLNNTGFLRAERELLRNRGWTYDPSTRVWSPPQP